MSSRIRNALGCLECKVKELQQQLDGRTYELQWDNTTAELSLLVNGSLETSVQIPSLSQPRYYEHYAVWAEENGALSNNQNEWSFGNGATGFIGMPLPPGDWELYAVGFNADVATPGAQVTMEVVDRNPTPAGTLIYSFIATGATNNINYHEQLATPVPIPGDVTIGFITRQEQGTVSDARVVAYIRRLVTTLPGV